MKSRQKRERELYENGMVSEIIKLFHNRRDISEKYYVLMADYIDCLDQVKNEMVINISDIFKKLPEVVKNIEDLNLNIEDDNNNKNIVQIQ